MPTQALTPRRAKAARVYAANPTMSKTETLRQAGYTEATARVSQALILNHPVVVAEIERRRARMRDALTKAGVDEIRLANRLNTLLESDNDQAALGAVDRCCRLLGLSDDDDSGKRAVTVILNQVVQVVAHHCPASLAARIIRDLGSGETQPARKPTEKMTEKVDGAEKDGEGAAGT